MSGRVHGLYPGSAHPPGTAGSALPRAVRAPRTERASHCEDPVDEEAPCQDPFNKDVFTKDTVTRSLSAVTKTPNRKVALAAAGLAVTGGAIAGPVLAV